MPKSLLTDQIVRHWKTEREKVQTEIDLWDEGTMSCARRSYGGKWEDTTAEYIESLRAEEAGWTAAIAIHSSISR